MKQFMTARALLFMSLVSLLIVGTGQLLAQPAKDDPRAVIAAKFFVDDDNAGQQDGSALRPFKTVQQAIDAAANNDVIAVAGGNYPQNIKVSEKAVRLYGGYAIGFKTRDPAANPSHLRGDGKDSVVILYESGATIVDGFLITGGGPSSVTAPQRLGGGLYIYGGTTTISHNVIEKNQTCPANKPDEDARGGGIYASGDGASVAILNNTIRNNVSGRGAGVLSDGPKVVLRGNLIQNNIGVADHGGGVYLNSPSAEISHNRFEGNEIGRLLGYGWGGGMIVVNKGGHYKLSNNIFAGNYAPSLGAGFFADEGAEASMDHDLVYGNKTKPDGEGAAVFVDGNDSGIGSTLTLNHVTIADNISAPMVKGGAVQSQTNSKLIVKNCIFWNNGGGDDVAADAKSKATVTYTLTEKTIKGIGNLSKDPLFVNSAKQDYHLSANSPAVNAAEGGRANLGAYGGMATTSKRVAETPAVKPNEAPPIRPNEETTAKASPPAEKAAKAYLLRGTVGELPSEVGDDNTKMTAVDRAVQVDLLDSFGQKQAAVGDWTSFETLRLDIESKSAKKLPVEFNLFHAGTTNFATRVVTPFVLKPGKNQIRLAVAELKNTNGSPAKLAEVKRWFIASEAPATLLVGDIVLESKGANEAPVNEAANQAPANEVVKETTPEKKTSKTFLLRGTNGELPTLVGDDNTKMTVINGAVQVDLIDSVGQSQSKIADWTSAEALRLDIESKIAKDMPVELNVFHAGTTNFATRVVTPFVLKPGKNEIRIALGDLKNSNGSTPKLSGVKRWFIASTTPGTLLVGDIYLEASIEAAPDTSPATPPKNHNSAPSAAIAPTVRNTEQLRAALGQAQPGTTIALAPGRYSPDISIEQLRGTKDRPILITAADERNPPVFGGGSVAFHFVACNYVTVRGIKVSGCTGNGINADDAGNVKEPSVGMTFENITIEDIGPKGTFNGLKLSGLDQFVVRGCTFSGWGGSAIDMVGCHDGVVQNCMFLGKAGFSQDTGVQLKGGSERIIVKQNFFKQAGSRAVNLGGSTDLEFFRPKVQNYEARDIEVAGNHIVGSRSPIAFASSIQCIVRNNTIVNPETWVLRILQEQPTDKFLPCQKSVFKANLIVFDRRVKEFANVGEDTKPETFSFAGNAWFSTDGARRPSLPAQETGGIYQVDPLLESAETPEAKFGSKDPRLLKVGAHAFTE